MTKEIIKKTKDIANPPLSGSTIEGIVVARDRAALYVDLGVHGTGVILGREFYEAKDIIKGLNLGDKVVAKVIELDNEDGYKELSLRDASKELGWQKLREYKDKGEILKVKIASVNKGGLLTNIDGIQAFLPVSQLASEHYPRIADADKQKILKELQKFIGKTLEVKVLDLMARENKLILSEKAKSEDKLKEILKNFKIGDVVEGQITGIADFGVFIKFPHLKDQADNEGDELKQIEGLIHISELDWQLVENPGEIVKVQDIVKAQIIGINNNQVFLSLKSLKKNPWEEIEKQYKKGDMVKGKIIKFSPFGSFVELPEKIRGLCHISEFGSRQAMEESLKEGENYQFEVLLVEPKEHRISLKLAK